MALLATGRRRLLIAAAALMLLLLGLVVYVAQNPVAASGTASLTIFVGTVNVRSASNLASHAAGTGEQLHQGDTVTTGPTTKAAINFPDGSVSRLDSNTELQITTLGQTGGTQTVLLTQLLGKTWNRVGQLVGGSKFNVQGPNHTTAQVRGTDFEIIVEQVNGVTQVRVDTFNGSVDVTAAGQTVTVPAGQSTTVASPASPPSPPAAIPPGDQTDSFTVFNTTVNASAGTAASVSPGTLSQGQTTPTQPGATVAGTDNVDLDVALGWPGSTFELIVYKPDGTLYQQVSSSSPPVHIVVPSATPGNWSYAVRDVQSNPNEAYWVIVGKSPAQNAGAPVFTTATPCTHQVTAGQTDSWKVTATSTTGTPALTATGLPSYASFAPDGTGSGTVTFNPPLRTPAADVDILFTAVVSGEPAVNFGCVEHVIAVPLNSSVSGHVAFLSGSAALVTVSLSPGGQTTHTDSLGNYSFIGLGAGTYTVTVTPPAGYVVVGPAGLTVSVSGADTALADFSLARTLAIATTSLPGGTVGSAYSTTLAGSGGVTPYSWALAAGSSLPAGLALDGGHGTISGTPTAAGTTNFTVNLNDSAGDGAQQALSITIAAAPTHAPPVTITTTSLPDGTANTPYSQSLAVSGGTSPYTCAVTGGSAPAGLSFGGTVNLSGTPSHVGTYTFTVTCTDSGSPAQSAAATFTVHIASATITLSPASLPAATSGVAYSQTITAGGGVGPYSFSVAGGSLPPGLTLDGSGNVTGTPTGSGGSYTFTAAAVDSQGSSGSAAYTITENPPPALTISPSTLPGADEGTSYSQPLTASGGAAPYSFSVGNVPAAARTAGVRAYPSWLALSGATLTVSPPAGSAGTYSFRITVTDKNGSSAFQDYTIGVTNGKVLILGTTDGGYDVAAVKATGLTPVEVTQTQWQGMTASQFAAYRAIVLGDPDCTGNYYVGYDNRSTWGPVIDGRVILYGTDPELHGRGAFVNDMVAFAAGVPGKTGLDFSLSCWIYSDSTYAHLPLDVLGSFTAASTGTCNVHAVGSSSLLPWETDANLNNWGCSVHEGFASWPSSFSVLAISTSGTGYLAPDGTVGTPYILERGATLTPPLTGAASLAWIPASYGSGYARTAHKPSQTLNAGIAESLHPTSYMLGAYNGDGSLNTAFTGTVAFSTTDPDTGASIPGSYTFTSADGGLHSFTFALRSLGTQSLTATATGLANAMVVENVIPFNFALAPSPGSPTAGTSFGFSITPLDFNHAALCGYKGTLVFASSDGTFTTPSSLTVSSPSGCTASAAAIALSGFRQTTAGSQTATVCDNLFDPIPYNCYYSPQGSATYTVNPAAFNHYGLVSSGSPLTAGTTATGYVTLEGQDAYNNVQNTLPRRSDTITLSGAFGAAPLPPSTGPCSAGPQIGLTGSGTTSALSSKGASFGITALPVSFDVLTCKVETQNLAGSSSHAYAFNPAGGLPITTQAGAATTLSITGPGSTPTSPLSATVGSWSPSFTYTSADALGNAPAIGSLNVGGNSGYGPQVAGCPARLPSLEFGNLAYGYDYILPFTSGSNSVTLTSGTASTTLYLSAGTSMNRFAFVQLPASVTATTTSGAEIGYPAYTSGPLVFEIDAADAYCNLITGYSNASTVNLTSSDVRWNRSSSGPNTTGTALVYGIAAGAFSGGKWSETPSNEYLYTSGYQNFTVTDTASGGLTSTSPWINVSGGYSRTAPIPVRMPTAQPPATATHASVKMPTAHPVSPAPPPSPAPSSSPATKPSSPG